MSQATPRVMVGLSGGVDSSVSAALLQRAGYDVTGVFIKVWQPDWVECSWREDRRDAMRVAACLGIPFITLDLEREYKTGVIDFMISEYASGRTPNPDVMCNREIKFGAFWKWASGQGADFVATGHYVQSARGPDGSYHMRSGADTAKDQSYFLWTLGQADLEHILFPIGHLQKPEVRRLAARFRLPTAEKKDSQGLCFIGHVDFKEFLARHIEARPGVVLDPGGNVIGSHPGAIFFTIGERHGFTLDPDAPHDVPHYVIAKDMTRNSITVAPRHENTTSPVKQLDTPCKIERTNWVRKEPHVGMKLLARSRYRQHPEEISVTALNRSSGTADIAFARPQTALTPGQSLVIYDSAGDECMGGGVIT